MKLDFQDLLPGEEPITSVAEYLAARRRYDELSSRLNALQLEMREWWSEGKEVPKELSDEYHLLEPQKRHVKYGFFRRQPRVLVSRCPYCAQAVWVKVGVFSLVDEFWYREDSDGRDDVPKDSRCSHLFCLDGALNLNGHRPTEAIAPITVVTNTTIKMAAQVPFVKPRVLDLPTMVAVIHSFPVADKYTAYPIVYFAEQQPSQEEFCIGWARQEYVDHLEGGKPIVFIGRRTDAQDYELRKWVEQGKLLWLDPTGDEQLIRGPVEAFPYNDVLGRRNPYTIKGGKVRNLRSPTTDGRPKVRLER
jgi:hypothetical protein